MRAALIFLVLLLGIYSCTGGDDRPVFQDIPARKPMQLEVVLKHRIAEAKDVKVECEWRARASTGVVMKAHPTFPACSWIEPDGTKIVLCTNPKSFNNHIGLEACGHEAFHFHEVVDHP